MVYRERSDHFCSLLLAFFVSKYTLYNTSLDCFFLSTCPIPLVTGDNITCDNKKQDIDYLNNHKEQLEDFVASFKSGNKRYLEIKDVAQEHVNYLLTQRKTMLTI